MTRALSPSRSHRALPLLAAGLFLVGGSLALQAQSEIVRGIGFIVFALGVYPFATALSLVCHEFAHAFAVLLTGGRVLNVEFGMAPFFLEAGPLRLGPGALGCGRVRYLPARGRGRRIVVLAAGMVAEAVLATAFLAAFWRWPNLAPLLAAAAAVCLVSLATSLVPRRHASGDASDGALILDAIRVRA